MVDFQLLDDVMDTVAGVVLHAPLDVQPALDLTVHEVLSTSDDYTRKVKLARWYQQLVADCVKQAHVEHVAT